NSWAGCGSRRVPALAAGQTGTIIDDAAERALLDGNPRIPNVVTAVDLSTPERSPKRGFRPSRPRHSLARMTLRNPADRRTLLWAFVLFPGVALGQYAFPALAGWT